MWLEKIFFCGSTLGPTTNNQSLAEKLADGGEVPLGNYLLGAAYSLLNQVSIKLSVGEPIGNIRSPWWFVQLWLNLYTHQAMGRNFKNSRFPSSNFSKEEETNTCRCMSFGEAVSAFSATGADVAQIFKSFYHGFSRQTTVWFAYNDADAYELPSKFRFSEVYGDGADIFKIIISPAVLPVGFHRGHNRLQSYEYYYPSIPARQLGFGRLPIKLFFSDKMRAREHVSSGLEFDRVHALESVVRPYTLDTFVYGSFSSKLFSQWWAYWKKHLLYRSSKTYCQLLDPDYIEYDDDVRTLST